MMVLATPNYGGYRVQYVGSLVDTVAAMGGAVRWMTKVSPYLGEARDWLAAEALKAGAEGVLWVDSDMGWRVADISLLLAEGERRKGDVVGAFYPSRGVENVCVGAPLEEKSLAVIMDRSVVEAHHLGMGFCWTPRGVLERLGGPPWFPTGYAGGRFVGEDAGFAERCHAAGVRLWGCAHLSVGHAYEPGLRTMGDWLKDYDRRRPDGV